VPEPLSGGPRKSNTLRVKVAALFFSIIEEREIMSVTRGLATDTNFCRAGERLWRL